jgi:hypothetical protein
MSVTSGWDLGSEADREAGWGRTVPLGVAGVTRRGPLDERGDGDVGVAGLGSQHKGQVIYDPEPGPFRWA